MNGAKDLTNGVAVAPNGNLLSNGNFKDAAAVWECFMAGADNVQEIRPEILMSWYRCREEYGVDPYLDRAPVASVDTERSPHSLKHHVVFARLGGVAAAAADEVGSDCLITVTDSDGHVLASYGRQDDLVLRRNWSERASGTNGIGTALKSHGPVIVAGPEHWCRTFHSSICAGIAVRDVITDQPLAALGISCWESSLPPAALSWLHKAVTATEATLRQRATLPEAALAGPPDATFGSTCPNLVSGRVVALRQDRWVLLNPAEIRFAEVDRNNLWLMSDAGRLLAATRGLDRLEQQLACKGFLRVHRRFLVNMNRIREISPGFKGSLFLHTDTRTHESIPVARRHLADVRHALGLQGHL
jgi:sigma-54 dependent transcriptional regulator, acetoin dehydrogenase operon transcriptional activator AcoR